MKFKAFIGALLSAVMLCLTPTAQAAAVETYSIVSPLYDVSDYAYSTLSISGTSASCSSRVLRSDAVEITATQYLQKQGFLWIWTTYDSTKWTKTVSTNVIYMSNTKTGLSSGKYRLKTVFKLTYSDGSTESITVYSDKMSVG